MHNDFLEIAQGDARKADFIREVIESLARHGNDAMREMAREVREGASLRDMARGGVYGDEVSAAFSTFWTRYQEMSSADRSELVETGRRYLDVE